MYKIDQYKLTESLRGIHSSQRHFNIKRLELHLLDYNNLEFNIGLQINLFEAQNSCS